MYSTCVQTHGQTQGDLCPGDSLNHLYDAFLLGFHFDLPHSESVFNISQDPPKCVHTLLAKMHSTKENYGWLSITPLLTSEEVSSLEGLFDINKWGKYGLLSGQGPVSSVNCPDVDIFEFLCAGNELKLLTLRRGGGTHLSPASNSFWDMWTLEILIGKIKCDSMSLVASSG